MWYDNPEQKLGEIKRRQAELAAEAAANRLATRRDRTRSDFQGLRIRLGSILIVVGRTLCEDEALQAGLVRR